MVVSSEEVDDRCEELTWAEVEEAVKRKSTSSV